MSRVTVTNPYDLLTDENEDRTNVPAKKEQKPAAAPAKPAAKPAAVAKPAAAKPAAAKPAAPKADGAKAPAKTDSKAAPKNSANQTVKPAPPRDSNQNLQERDKESRAPRDKRDHRQAPPAGERKRTFDRKSGTGRSQTEQKKGGQGKGNWGSELDAKEGAEALKDKEEKVSEEKEEGETKEGVVAVEGEKKEGEAKVEAPASPKEEEVFTLDEYLAKKKANSKLPQLDAFKPRTVNADDFGAAGLVPLQRGESGVAPLQPKAEKKDKKVAAEKPADAAAAPAGEKKENLAAKIFTFASHQDQNRERRPFRNYENRQGGERSGERSDRRGPRQNRPPRSDSKGDVAANKPPVQEKDFPTLGVKA